MKPRAWAVVAGGGTGGHVVPALAIARALVARGHEQSTIHFVGSKRGIDERLVRPTGFPLTLLPGRGLPRTLSLQNVKSAVQLAWSIVRMLAAFARARPAVVVSVGGYASVPASLAAVFWRVPLVLLEQNVVPGAANRLVARWAKACAVTFAGTPLPRTTVVGQLVRPEMAALDRSPTGRAAARAALGVDDDRVLVFVTGGSLGARRINDAVAGLAQAWARRDDVAIRHVVGRRDWPEFAGKDPVGTGALQYEAVEFEDRMDLALTAADVAVGRAGGNTVAELAAAGVPAVLVPLPIATEDHQTANARAVVAAGAGVLVPDGELDGPRLEAELGPIVDDPTHRDRMAAGMATLARPDAADRVAQLVEEHARA